MTANVENASDNLSSKTVYELKTIAKANGLRGYSRLKKDELLNLITTPRNISTKKELQEIAKERGFKNYTKLTKTKLDAIIRDNTPEHKKRKVLQQELYQNGKIHNKSELSQLKKSELVELSKGKHVASNKELISQIKELGIYQTYKGKHRALLQNIINKYLDLIASPKLHF